MKALSIRQPWAYLIAKGHKSIENRDWRYAPKLRGPIAIHAAKGCTRDEYEYAISFAESIDSQIVIPPLKELPRGGLVATCQLVDVAQDSDDPWFVGKLGFLLSDVREIDFVECKGKLGFFYVDYES